MSSVNPNVRIALPLNAPNDPATSERTAEDVGTPGTGFTGGLTAMGSSLWNTVTDAGTFVGVDTDEDGDLKAGVNPLALGGFAAVTAGPVALASLGGRTDAFSGVKAGFGETFKTNAAATGIRVTPTLVSAIAGPAVADGVTMIAPNLVKKYTNTSTLKTADERKAAEKNNQYAKISRAVAGGVAVGLAAGAVFLLKPDLFKKFGIGVTHALESSSILDGTTKFAIDGGKAVKVAGVLDDAAIRATMASVGKPLATDSTIQILKTVSPMAKDAVFSNRLLMAGAGGAGTLLLANAAAGEDDPGRAKLMWGLTAAAGAATIGGTWGIGKLTSGQVSATGEATGILGKNQLFWKPNVEWIKKYAGTIAPITAVPAGTAASQYFNIFNDFDEITATRSPFRK